MTRDPNLASAYALRSKAGVRKLYEEWADTYDASFVEAQGYQMPARIAETCLAHGGRGPVLDVGAGTGAVAAPLAVAGLGPIDAMDLSRDMLKVAGAKGLYRNLICADITKPLGPLGPYETILSAGTFTFGHVGPEGLPALFDVAAPGCLFVLGVNAAHFAAAGFEAAMSAHSTGIDDLVMTDVRIYDDRADADHREDLARILVFRKK